MQLFSIPTSGVVVLSFYRFYGRPSPALAVNTITGWSSYWCIVMLDDADDTAPTHQNELDHTDHIDHSDHVDHIDQEYIIYLP